MNKAGQAFPKPSSWTNPHPSPPRLNPVNRIVSIRTHVNRAISPHSHTSWHIRRWQARACFQAYRQVLGHGAAGAVYGVNFYQTPRGGFGHYERAPRRLRYAFW